MYSISKPALGPLCRTFVIIGAHEELRILALQGGCASLANELGQIDVMPHKGSHLLHLAPLVCCSKACFEVGSSCMYVGHATHLDRLQRQAP